MSRYTVLSKDYNSTGSLSVPKPPSVRPRKFPQHPPTFKRGQICLVEETIFSPLCEALNKVDGPLETRSGLSLTAKSGKVVPVSSGPKRRPCIIMAPPSNRVPVGSRKQGYFICVMATFASSEGQYERLGKLLQRFVVPVEPNEQVLPAFKTDPAWRHPQQWAIVIVVYTEQPIKPYTSRDGQGRRLSTAEYDRLSRYCKCQWASWESDIKENNGLKQEVYEELVDWRPDLSDADKTSIYSCRSNASAFSVNSFKSFYTQHSRRGSIATLQTIFESATPTYPSFTLNDFPPLPSKVCAVH
ncbi:hypothetical protein DFS33DRAFT_1484095 [Desarmillaria ectypa]|nr:hypothetical protein DFS33DRAFT_1484095 [Desarmillaria ectypa]